MTAYLVPDPSLPLVNISVLLRLGPDQDPAGKEGATGLMMDLLTSGGTRGPGRRRSWRTAWPPWAPTWVRAWAAAAAA